MEKSKQGTMIKGAGSGMDKPEKTKSSVADFPGGQENAAGFGGKKKENEENKIGDGTNSHRKY
ncbi:MAG: hypothetical protein ACK40G_00225 [Cytophagaceae bacterium]